MEKTCERFAKIPIDMKPAVSIIIVHYKVKFELFDCLHSIQNSKPETPYEIIVIDNDEEKTIAEDLKKTFPDVIYIKSPQNKGFGAGNNLGTLHAKGKYLLFLNPDTQVFPGAVDNLFRFLEEDVTAGVVAPLLLNPLKHPYELQGLGELTPLRAVFGLSILNRLFPKNPISQKYWLLGWDKTKRREVQIVPGTAFMISKQLFNKIGKFDEHFFLYFEEADLCKRIISEGYSLWIIPQAKIIHLWGRSTKKILGANNAFSESKYYYFKKHYGTAWAIIVQTVTTFNIALIGLTGILLSGAFLRFFLLPQLMLFIGDQGWFYLSARDLLVNRNIPLLGIQSSVVWLHQGPLATYVIALGLLLARFNPVGPAFLLAGLDILTIFLLFLFGKKYFGPGVGLLAAFFYATSPLALVNARMPYHTTLIPLFSVLFLFVLAKVIEKKDRFLPILFFLLGILLQLELSNGILLVVLFILFLIHKPRIRLSNVLTSIAGFIIGALPFFLYDITHKFVYSLGLPLWIVNRTRLFFGLTMSHISTTANIPDGLYTIFLQMMEFIFPASITIAAGILMLVGLGILAKTVMSKEKDKRIFIALTFLFVVPLLGYAVHTTPGTAYFPLLFPFLALLIGVTFVEFSKTHIIIVLLPVFLAFCNVYATLQQNFYVSTLQSQNTMPPASYSYGPSLPVLDDIASFVVRDARGNSFSLQGGGFLQKLTTGTDNYQYLVWWHGGKLANDSPLQYTIYQDPSEIPSSAKIVYGNRYIYVGKHETF